MKKGFTLIELIAVIVIIGVVMLIVVPNAIDIYNSSRKKLFESTVEKLYDAAEVYKRRYELSNGTVASNLTLNIKDRKIDYNELSLDGKLPESGTILFDEFGNVSVVAYDEGFCGEKLFTDNEVTIIKSKKEDCYLYNVQSYKITANDFNIVIGDIINLSDYAYLSRYKEKVEDAIITYTSNPTFDSNKLGEYVITYSTEYKGNTYTKDITVKVEKDDFEPPVLAISVEEGYFKSSGNLVLTAFDSFGLHDENVYQYYVSTSNTELKDGEWKYYVSDEMFSISGINETKYLWVYPIRDKNDNINNNKTLGESYVIGTYIFDSTKPRISEESTIVDNSGTVILTITDEGGSELSSDNKYKYYLSTSNTELKDGEWKNYKSGEAFAVSGVNQTKYLWIYPIEDNSGNINDGHTDINQPYVIANYSFKTPYTLTVNLNGGINDMKDSYILRINETVAVTDPTREHYVFEGWSVSGTGVKLSDGIFTMGSSNATLAANWTPINYTITYNLNGGTQASGAKTSYNIETATFSLPTPTRTSYTFEGWYASSELTGTAVTQIAKGSTGNKTYYAKWTPINYTITYNLNSGTQASGAKTSYNIETATYTLPTPTRTGYTFGGWYTSSGLTGTAVTQIAKGSTGNKTYYAKWTANTYTIAYNCNGGSGSTASSTHTYGTAKKLTSNGCYKITAGTGTGTSATPMVYYLVGWSKSSTATTATYTNAQSVTNVSTSGNVTLYAVWAKLFTYSKKYTVISDGSGNWRVKFLETGTFIPKTATSIDAFLVGGGGGGTAYQYANASGAGGGGGYTKTSKAIAITANTSYTITIGAGGAAVYGAVGKDGGATSAFNVSAAGGYGAGRGKSGNKTNRYYGGDGGSGGGGVGTDSTGASNPTVKGGNNGGNGGNGTYGGTGQGTTTREFGETTGDLYAGGGAGCKVYTTAENITGAAGGGGGIVNSVGQPGTANTGGGGAGSGRNDSANNAGNGGSGIVVIRNKR